MLAKAYHSLWTVQTDLQIHPGLEPLVSQPNTTLFLFDSTDLFQPLHQNGHDSPTKSLSHQTLLVHFYTSFYLRVGLKYVCVEVFGLFSVIHMLSVLGFGDGYYV